MYLFGVSEMTEVGDEAGGMCAFYIISQKKLNSSKSLYGREADSAGGEKVISGVVSCCISGCDGSRYERLVIVMYDVLHCQEI